MPKRDLIVGIAVGFLIGFLFLPLLKAAELSLYESFKFLVVPFFVVGTPLGLFVAYLLSIKVPVMRQIGKFGVIGVLNTLVDWGVLTLLPLVVGISFENALLVMGASVVTYYSLYKGISFLVAVVNSFFWNKYWVFEERGSLSRSEFAQFLVVSGVGFFINVGLASIVFIAMGGIELFNPAQRAILAAALATVISMAWNFIGYKLFVFRNS